MANRHILSDKANKIQHMKLQLIQGNYSREDAMELISQLAAVKIRFLESKIEKSLNEEDIHMRERRIQQLQHDLVEAKREIQMGNQALFLETEILIP